MRLGIIITAITTYVAVLGCVLMSSHTEGNTPFKEEPSVHRNPRTGKPLTGIPYRGVALQLQRVDLMDQYKKCIDDIVNVGADTVMFVVDGRQEHAGSSHIYLDMRCTPTGAQLTDIIKYAKDRKLRVVLMPIVLLDEPRKSDEWRGTIQPADWDKWWDSYRSMMSHFAYIAHLSDVDILVVGSELVSTQDKLAQWTRTISEIRHIFCNEGSEFKEPWCKDCKHLKDSKNPKLTYSANWDNYMHVPFWDQLDLIGMNSYWSLGKDKTASVEEISGNWQRIQKEVLAFTKRKKMPLMLLEAGWCSLENAAHEPWDYTREEYLVDVDLQRRLYEGFFRSWYGHPDLGGFMLWCWELGDGGPRNKSYTPKGKPAEKVLRDWYAKPWERK